MNMTNLGVIAGRIICRQMREADINGYYGEIWKRWSISQGQREEQVRNASTGYQSKGDVARGELQFNSDGFESGPGKPMVIDTDGQLYPSDAMGANKQAGKTGQGLLNNHAWPGLLAGPRSKLLTCAGRDRRKRRRTSRQGPTDARIRDGYDGHLGQCPRSCSGPVV
jgi:hypothetical protein